ncbi:MAG: Smr/MutS family protein [Pseudomonadota bacterium]
MADRSLRPEEKRAWARVARKVRPLAGTNFEQTMESLLGSSEPPSSSGSKSSSVLNTGRAKLATNVKTTTPSAGLQDRSRDRKVRRGKIEFAASLDLHGHTQETAHTALRSFLVRQRDLGARTVLVITGKGKRGEGILRQRFLQWLETPEARSAVSGFSPAHQKHGGGGAWYVFLRRKTD